MKRVSIAILIIFAGILSIIFLCNKIIVDSAIGKLYNSTDSMPFNKVGILLGTSKFIANGRENPYYNYRIEAAVKLYHSHKVKYIIISGDNGSKNYNEPVSMRNDLMKAGVDSAIIFLDYAGFRTFDSIKRLKEIFGQDSATIISQQFHNERAIYIAQREGIFAIGFNARDVGNNSGIRMQMREKLARVKVFVDYWFGKKPKYLGKKVLIHS